MIGFGLSHSYPVSEKTKIQDVVLKGSDAALMSIFNSLGLEGEAKVIYDGGGLVSDDYESIYEHDDNADYKDG